MFSRPLAPDHLLRSLIATDVFGDYCRERGVALEATSPSRQDGVTRWAKAMALLPSEAQQRIEFELAMVNELSDGDAIMHLLTAAGGSPPPENVPSGFPTALWFLLHRPLLFREVFFHHEIREIDAWRTGWAKPGIVIPDLERCAVRLQETLSAYFGTHEGVGRFSTSEGTRLPEAVCLLVRFADRLRLVEGFTDAGRATLARLRPAVPVLFLYHPREGTVLVRSHLRAADRVAGLLRCFGEAVLGSPVAYVNEAFDLDRLKFPFHPLPDAEDMEMVRVKALHLCYPQRRGQRVVKLETRSTDEPVAIEELLRSHVSATDLGLLRVSHAELQVRARVDGRGRNYVIRLWPNRCSLNETAAGDRLRSCLRKWGLCHARER